MSLPLTKVLITGGAGFIGSVVANHFIKWGFDVEILDSLTYAADTSRLLTAKIITHDIIHPIPLGRDYDYILHFAAETHVDNSIQDPGKFVMTNVVGTFNMLEFARRQNHLTKFLYFSTDEVFGPAPAGINYREWDRYNSGNPYSATKAGGEELTLAYGNTYKLPVVITHTMNAFGPGQNIEKFIPSTIARVKKGLKVIIHSDETRTISGSRFYIHVSDIADAVRFVLELGDTQEKYNIVGREEITNLDVAKLIAELLGSPLDYEMVDFHRSRPGHDLRYSLDGQRLKWMGWEPKLTFKEGLKELINGSKN